MNNWCTGGCATLSGGRESYYSPIKQKEKLKLPFYFLLTRLLDLTCSWVSKDTTSVVLNGLFRTDMTYFCSPSSPD